MSIQGVDGLTAGSRCIGEGRPAGITVLKNDIRPEDQRIVAVKSRFHIHVDAMVLDAIYIVLAAGRSLRTFTCRGDRTVVRLGDDMLVIVEIAAIDIRFSRAIGIAVVEPA